MRPGESEVPLKYAGIRIERREVELPSILIGELGPEPNEEIIKL